MKVNRHYEVTGNPMDNSYISVKGAEAKKWVTFAGHSRRRSSLRQSNLLLNAGYVRE